MEHALSRYGQRPLFEILLKPTQPLLVHVLHCLRCNLQRRNQLCVVVKFAYVTFCVQKVSSYCVYVHLA